MRKITVLEFCSRIGIDSDEIPVVVKAGFNIVGRYRSLYKLTSQAMPTLLEATAGTLPTVSLGTWLTAGRGRHSYSGRSS